MKIKAIFYDFDGVIKESTQIKTAAFYELYLPFGESIAREAKEHHIENGGISRFEKFKYYHKTFLNTDLSHDEIQSLAEKFSDIVLQKVIESNYVKGSLECIEKLSNKLDQFIVTGTPQNEIKIILNQLGISHFFKGIYGSPDSKIVISKRILDAFYYNTNEVLFIGDATTDYHTASHFNFHFILREHGENKSIFKSINTIKSEDLSNLEELINNI